MRKTLAVFAAALAIAACSNDSTAPDILDPATLDAGAFGTALTIAGGYDAVTYQDRLTNGLPDSLALSDTQKAQIKSLVDAFVASSKADRDALAAIFKEARDAIAAHKTRAEIEAILQKGRPIRERLIASEAKLRSDIDAVLTPAQRAWITSHRPNGCRPDRFPPLTDAQKAQIKSLEQAFQTANAADLALMKSIFQEVAAAKSAGKSRQEIEQILAKGADAAKRLNAARIELRSKILAVLTPQQRGSGCLPLG
jgi:Spy/CpxP family protein refolding chaperone